MLENVVCLSYVLLLPIVPKQGKQLLFVINFNYVFMYLYTNEPVDASLCLYKSPCII